MRRAFLILALTLPALAAAECRPIWKVPAQIVEPGCHRLESSAELALGAGAAIEILVDDVVLDLGGQVLANLAGRANTAYGVMAYRRSNVTVRNGTLRGFQTGIGLGLDRPDGTFGGYAVHDVQLHESRLFGLDLRGTALVARGNRVLRTGGTQQPGRSGEAVGIFMQGTFVTVVDNDVLGAMADPFESYGIRVADANAAVVERNRVLATGTAISLPRGATGASCRDNTAGEIAVQSFDCPLDAGGNGGQIR